MIFVGSREYLHYINSDFKDVWISLVRGFNRFPRKKLDVNKVRESISSLKEKVVILKAGAIKQNQGLLSDQSIEDARLPELKKNSAGLVAALEGLEEELNVFSQQLPKGNATLSYKDIISPLAKVELRIKTVRNLIAVFGRSYVEVTRRTLLKKSIPFTKKAVIGLLAAGALTQTLQQGLVFLAKDLPIKKEGLAILISYHTHATWDKYWGEFAKLFIPAYVARIELAFGQKANWVKKAATSGDFFEAIKDESIQNIVLYGHGSWDSWKATNRSVDSFELEEVELEHHIHKKGLLVRHTCGQGQKLADETFYYLSPEHERRLVELIKSYNKKISPSYISLQKSIDNWMDTIPKGYYYQLGVDGKNRRKGYIFLPFTRDEVFKDFKEHLKAAVGDTSKDSPEIDEMMKIAKEVLKTVKYFKVEQSQLLGVPVFKRENIKGWNRKAVPLEFIFNVFGQADTNRDRLY